MVFGMTSSTRLVDEGTDLLSAMLDFDTLSLLLHTLGTQKEPIISYRINR